MGRVATWAAGAVLAVVLLIVAAAAGVISAVTGGGTGGEVCLTTTAGTDGTSATVTADQARNAEVIVAVGARMRVPVRGWVIAIATALQESGLINHGDLGAANDHDSLGLFQQRPSQGWGTPAQIMTRDYAAGKFYEALLGVPGWQAMPLTAAAQTVQRSAYPDAYA
ncbi:MAG TPA: M23 family peptidase, partial [Pilimelia sp.]|nr:M23 family peptidase [Pilimelia sp.]